MVKDDKDVKNDKNGETDDEDDGADDESDETDGKDEDEDEIFESSYTAKRNFHFWAFGMQRMAYATTRCTGLYKKRQVMLSIATMERESNLLSQKRLFAPYSKSF
jgi:ABC-type Zn2+ transport system substrate-binding protein/surface adhesin